MSWDANLEWLVEEVKNSPLGWKWVLTLSSVFALLALLGLFMFLAYVGSGQ